MADFASLPDEILLHIYTYLAVDDETGDCVDYRSYINSAKLNSRVHGIALDALFDNFILEIEIDRWWNTATPQIRAVNTIFNQRNPPEIDPDGDDQFRASLFAKRTKKVLLTVELWKQSELEKLQKSVKAMVNSDLRMLRDEIEDLREVLLWDVDAPENIWEDLRRGVRQVFEEKEAFCVRIGEHAEDEMLRLGKSLNDFSGRKCGWMKMVMWC